jgi:outer membrane protein TolC
LAALQYEAGQIDLFLSLDTQRTLLSLQQQQVSTMTQQATASIQLYKALGGGWSKN